MKSKHLPEFRFSKFEEMNLKGEKKMKRHIGTRRASLIIAAGIVVLLAATGAMAQRRRVAVVRHPHLCVMRSPFAPAILSTASCPEKWSCVPHARPL